MQRVLENTEVYRARLAGKDVPLRILADLYAPECAAMPVLSAPVRLAAKQSELTQAT